MLAPTVMEFIDHVSGESSTHQVGHQVETSYNSLLIDNHYTFTLDGEDIWDHLKRAGITVKSGFMDGKPLWVQYRISRDGEEIARVESSSIHVHEEDLEGKGKLANLIPARGFYRIWTREQNVDLLFVTMMAFARTGANDENGGNFGLLFNK